MNRILNSQQALSLESPELRVTTLGKKYKRSTLRHDQLAIIDQETYNDYISQAHDTNTLVRYYSCRQESIRYYMDLNKYYHKTFFEYRFSTDNDIFYNEDLEEFIEDFNLFTNTFPDKFKDQHHPVKLTHLIWNNRKLEFIPDDMGETSNNTKSLKLWNFV
ncbi:unnamed protein product [Rhizophagus irregularis]|uniref:Uncharacterized protein n=1 Tax=Rhizophagus irregularis TaxID=588596 RepID=A0A2I1H2I3_9GLOM|nr:hypothetical protein RhiirA4_471062 [Rhizophagus irregularis]CAB4430837.1 unnamed protein product [Rhizophagus irregularis]